MSLIQRLDVAYHQLSNCTFGYILKTETIVRCKNIKSMHLNIRVHIQGVNVLLFWVVFFKGCIDFWLLFRVVVVVNWKRNQRPNL